MNKGSSQLTEKQQEERKGTLGASEIASVMGVDLYRNILDIALEKLGKIEPFEGNQFTEWGNRLEIAIAEGYADRMGNAVRYAPKGKGTIVHPKHDWMSATPDAMVYIPGQNHAVDRFLTIPGGYDVSLADRGLEVKNRGWFNRDAWGEPGTDQAPVEVVAQCQWSMGITGLKRWDIAVLLGGNNLGIYHIEFDEELFNDMVNIGHAFWHTYIVPGVLPPLDGSATATRYLNQKYSLHGMDLKEPNAEVLEDARKLHEAREKIKHWEEAKAEKENLLKEFIGNAAGIQLPKRGTITWKRPKGAEKTNWYMVAVALKRGRHKKFDQAVAIHTEMKEATRRFLPQFRGFK